MLLTRIVSRSLYSRVLSLGGLLWTLTLSNVAMESSLKKTFKKQNYNFYNLKIEHPQYQGALFLRQQRQRQWAAARKLFAQQKKQEMDAITDRVQAFYEKQTWEWWCQNHSKYTDAFYKRFSKQQRKEKRSILYPTHPYARHILAAYNRQRSLWFNDQKQQQQAKAHNKALKEKYFNNRFSFLKDTTAQVSLLHRMEDESGFSFQYEPESEVVRMIPNKKQNFRKSDQAQEGLYQEKKTPARSTPLLQRIRNILFNFQLKRKCNALKAYIFSRPVEGEILLEEISPCTEVIVHEMDEPSAHGTVPVVLDKQENTILTETTEVSSALTTDPQFQTWSDYCSNENKVDYNSLCSRWLQIDTFTWSKDHLITKYWSYILPKAYVLQDTTSTCNIPNSIPFRIYRYWRGDLEVKIHINSNKFQIGSLQVGWLYGYDLDENREYRNNIYSMSQINHVIINASTSNEATLSIPFKHYLPLMPTRDRTDQKYALNMGRLFIRVLNPLTVAVSGPSDCMVTVFVRCLNNEFTGMLSGDINPLKFEMDTIGGSLGELALNCLFPDRNRDNPPKVTPPMYVVPTATHSWSAGSGVNAPLHSLRLDLKGQTPHPPGIEVTNEMMIDSIVRTYGLLKTLIWSKDTDTEIPLFKIEACPLFIKSEYVTHLGSSDFELETKFIPPIGVLSSMFMGFRGTIEFKFDIVSSQYATGRLMVGYIPGVDSSAKITKEQLKCSTYTIFSIQDTSSFTYSVPYIANKPVWPRRLGGDYESQDSASPSCLYLFILNKLIPMAAVPNNIFINVYMRAGEDFELLVPVQPALGLSWNRNFKSSKQYPTEIIPMLGFDPYYSGSFEDLDVAQCFRWGQYSHQICHFNGVNYYNAASKTVSYSQLVVGPGQKAPMVDNGTKMVAIEYCVFIYLNQLGYIIGVPTLSKENAMFLATNIYVLGLNLNNPLNEKLVISNAISTSSNTFGTIGMKWKVVEYSVPGYEIGEQNKNVILASIGETSSTLSGFNLYGEKFNDLKDLCRRYQFYGRYQIKGVIASDVEHVSFRFPLVPSGLDLQLGTTQNINELHNRLRDGHIPIVASGFRFFRGGLRYRLVMNQDTSVSFTVILQHRPDRRLHSYAITFNDATVTGDSIQNHTYASYIQFTHINNVIEFEIPFYLFGMYGLLQRSVLDKLTDEHLDFSSLGDINVSIINLKSKSNITFDIFYAIADDMSFSTFQGFPPMLICNDVAPSQRRVKQKYLDYEIINHEMLSWFSPSTLLRNVGNDIARTQFSEIKESMKDTAEKVANHLKEKYSDIDLNDHSNIAIIGLELLHLVNHKDISTLALVVIKILIHFKMIVIESLLESVQVVANMLFSWLQSRPAPELDTAGERSSGITHEMSIAELNIDEWKGVLAMLFAGISGLLKVKCSPPTNWSSLSTFFTSTVPQICRGTVFIVGFFSVIGAIVKRLTSYIISKVYPLESWYYQLDQDMPSINAWINECLYLDSVDLVSNIRVDSHLRNRVYAAYVIGQNLMSHFGGKKEFIPVSRVFDIIKKKYMEMTELGIHPFVRKEPFVLWVSGKTRMGKSYLTEHLSNAMLNSINYDLKNSSRVFTIMPTNDFWSGCKQQPVLNMDDAFSVELGTTVERTLNYIYMVKSSAVLNPPQAALEEKHHRYNPEIFYINSNKSFINIAGVDPTAVHSRRDVLVEVEFSDPQRQELDMYSREELQNFSHLSFRVACKAGNIKTEFELARNYQEFKDFICDKFKQFHRDETENFLNRMATYDAHRTLEQEDERHMYSLNEEIERLKQQNLEMYEDDLERSLYTKFIEIKDYCAKMPKKILDKMFNKYLSFEIAAEMDKPSCSHTPTSAEFKFKVSVPIGDIYIKGTKNFFTGDPCVDVLLPRPEGDYVPDCTYEFGNYKCSARCYRFISTYYLKTNYKYKKILIDPFIENLHDIAPFESLDLIFQQIMNASWELRYRDFGFLCNEVLGIVKRAKIYRECKHLRIGIWNVGTQKWDCLNGVKISPKICDGDCIFSHPILKHMYHVAWLLSESHYFWTLRNLTEVIDFPPYFRSVNSDCIRTQIIEWQGTMAVRVKEMILYKIPRLVVNTLAIISIIGTIVGSFMIFTNCFYNLACCTFGTAKWLLGPIGGMNRQQTSVVSSGITKPEVCPLVGEGHAYSEPKAFVEPKATRNVPHTVGESSTENINNILRLISANSFFIKAEFVDSNNRLISNVARGIRVYGNVALFIKHYHEEFLAAPANTIFTFQSDRQTKGSPLQIDYLRCRTKKFLFTEESYGSNFILLELPKTISAAKDIRNLFMTTQEHHKVGIGAKLYQYGNGLHHGLNIEYVGPFYIGEEGCRSGVNTMNGYSYPMHGKGMCGSVLLADLKTNSPIIGIHVAGGGGTGYAEPVYREMFDIYPTDVVGAPDGFLSTPILCHESPKVEIDTTVFYKGVVVKKEAHIETGISKIIPSIIQGVFDVRTEPNPLKKNDPRLYQDCSPMKVGCELMGLPVSLFDEKIVDYAVENYTQVILNVKPLKPISILPLEIAICGDTSYPHYEPLNWKTSPGFKFKVCGQSGKKELFDLEETVEGFKLKGIKPKLQEILDEKENMRLNNIVPETVFVDCLKDTCLPREKCRIPGKTRIFSISPVDFTIQFKQYCGDFCAAMTAGRLKAEHAIGIAVAGPEWSELANFLTSFGPNFVTGDYSNYGPGMSLQIAHRAFDIIIEWYKFNGATIGHLKVLNVMRYEILGATHLCFNLLYSVCCGIPSGSPITSILNSMVNSLYIRCAYYSILSPSRYVTFYDAAKTVHKPVTYRQFTDHVRLITYGDDLVMAVKDSIIEEFNFASISKYFSSVRVKFTPADKDMSKYVKYYTDIRQITFLSCGFKMHPTRPMQWLAPLKMISIHSCANWIRKSGDEKQASLDNALQACMLTFGHGPGTFTLNHYAILKAFKSLNITFMTPSWKEYDEMFFNDKIMVVDENFKLISLE